MPGAVPVLLAAVLSFAGVQKLRAPAPFHSTLQALVPAAAARVLLRAIPLLELALAALLVAGVAPRAAAIASALLLAAFSVALVRLRATAPTVRCSCFGAGEGDADPARGLLRNALLIALALAAAIAPATLGGDPALLLADALGALAVACAWLLLGALRDLSTGPAARA